MRENHNFVVPVPVVILTSVCVHSGLLGLHDTLPCVLISCLQNSASLIVGANKCDSNRYCGEMNGRHLSDSSSVGLLE